MSISKEWLDFLREQYPAGSRIKLRKMGSDEPCPIQPGAMGTLQYIDDVGTVFVDWDNGRGLGLVMGQDSFTILPPPLQTLKLYMPMTATYYDEDELEQEQEITLDSREIVEYAPQIISALQSECRWLEDEGPEAAERGLMVYFDGPDSVEQKVQSYFFNAEVREGRLWGVAECKVRGELTPLELQHLIDDIGGQASDGVGESFEQREIQVDGGLEIYAHLWQSGGWSIMPERDRFDPHFSERLPDLCFTVLPGDGSLAYIVKGAGPQRSEDSSEQPYANRHLADYYNQDRGISEAQVRAMEGGCLYGWDSPAADPRAYEQPPGQSAMKPGEEMGGMPLSTFRCRAEIYEKAKLL